MCVGYVKKEGRKEGRSVVYRVCDDQNPMVVRAVFSKSLLTELLILLGFCCCLFFSSTFFLSCVVSKVSVLVYFFLRLCCTVLKLADFKVLFYILCCIEAYSYSVYCCCCCILQQLTNSWGGEARGGDGREVPWYIIPKVYSYFSIFSEGKVVLL